MNQLKNYSMITLLMSLQEKVKTNQCTIKKSNPTCKIKYTFLNEIINDFRRTLFNWVAGSNMYKSGSGIEL